MTRLFFVAGEASGDMHGASLVRALREACPDLVCEGLGGTRMAAAGMALRYDLAGEAVMGFTEVVMAFGRIRRVFLDTVEHLKQNRPDALVLIDYPGFNLRLAKKAKGLGIRVIYYISPQVWAWKRNRIHTLARIVNKMLVILPFEQKLYAYVGANCAYVGHPLLDQIAAFRQTVPRPAHSPDSGRPVIGLLPGSREQEIGRLFGVMLDVARGLRETYPAARFVTACVDDARAEQVRGLAGDFPMETVIGNTYAVLDRARFCLVASGTATLETALFGVPMAVLYKVSPLTYWIARQVVHVEHIALVNILAGRGIVPEFIQHEARPDTVLPRALELIADTPARAQMVQDLAAVRAALGEPGASARAAAEILTLLQGETHA